MPREGKLLRYQTEDFYHLVQGYVWDEDKKPPCRDADSVRLIREIDHAEFMEGDWYSVVTPFNRTNMTALCGGTKYALTVIANSRSGFYISDLSPVFQKRLYFGDPDNFIRISGADRQGVKRYIQAV